MEVLGHCGLFVGFDGGKMLLDMNEDEGLEVDNGFIK